MSKARIYFLLRLLVFVLILVNLFYQLRRNAYKQRDEVVSMDSTWHAPSYYTDPITDKKTRDLVLYGEDLIAHTARYYGPKGSINQNSNGLNCQNCHLQAGKKINGNNYGAVYATYPKFRARSGTYESIYKRVSDCFERSLHGVAPDSSSKEFAAIYAYIKWLGKDVPKHSKLKGTGIKPLPYLDRAASPLAGAQVFTTHCVRCHGSNGEGQISPDQKEFTYPPLWGNHSYTTAAGLYRIGNLAGFVKYNMPYKESDTTPYQLTDQEAWDVAAYINSQPRAAKNYVNDWPDRSKKPVDYPFGPFVDGFSEQEHKFGPYAPIVAAQKSK